MGNYHPFAPYVLGMQWVPIRQEDYLPDQITEIGYTFDLPLAATVVSGGISVAKVPESFTSRHSDPVYIYKRGTEVDTGPIQTITLAATSIIVSGNVTGNLNAILNPSDGESLFIAGSGLGFSSVEVSFGSAPIHLFGKRIVDISVLYTAWGETESLRLVLMGITDLARNQATEGGLIFMEGLIGDRSEDLAQINRMSLGDMNFYAPNGTAPRVPHIYPWRFQEYNEFSIGDTRRVRIELVADASSPIRSVRFGFMTMQIKFCEERRLGYGAIQAQLDILYPINPYHTGLTVCKLKDTNFADIVNLPAGQYTATVVHNQLNATGLGIAVGGLLPNQLARGTGPTLRALRQLYQLPSHQGLRINQSKTVGETFTKEVTNILPPITLYTTAAAVTGTHPYSDQVAAPVFDGTIASQGIQGNPLSVNTTFHQLRFYARRFGSTINPLKIDRLGNGATITPEEFDALPEIFDGWKEVTLKFASPEVFTADIVLTYTWSATGESAGNHWEILGANADTLTGLNQWSTSRVNYPDWQFEDGTSGRDALATWKAPLFAVTATDTTTDLILLLAQDPPAVTGFGLSPQSQAITGIGLDCGVSPDCIPTGISFHRLSWNMGVTDRFSRVVANGWGTSDSGDAWTAIGGAASDYSVNGTHGVHSINTFDVDRRTIVGAGLVDVEVVALITMPVIVTGSTIQAEIEARYIDENNFYMAVIEFDVASKAHLRILKKTAGVFTGLKSLFNILPYFAGAQFWLKFNVTQSILRAKAWRSDFAEPVGWMIEASDTSHTTGTTVGRGSVVFTGNLNTLPIQILTDNFCAYPSQLTDDGFYELQRMDTEDTNWQTIMRATSGCTQFFDDFEARVGIQSSYRIRICNALDFCGPWSTTVTGTIPAPGVQGADAGNSTLIFTTNTDRSKNLAHIMVWAGTVDEQFEFLEAQTAQLQRMFNRDFQVAFRPLERGGERFTRTILVQAAAIALPSLGNFRSLRDMAWADVPYICVRDELGNRWFATVIVPDGNVRNNRKLYLAQVEIVEVTDVPSPVDPL